MTSSYHPKSELYNVTWTLNSPKDYSQLTGAQAGGLDPTSAARYNQIVNVTGINPITSTVMAAGETIYINNVIVTFSTVDTLSTIITKINNLSNFTKVIADQRVATNYLTLANLWGEEGKPFYISEGNGSALYKLGLTPGSYGFYPSEVATTPYSNVSVGSNITINGIAVTFNSSGNAWVAANQINSMSPYTGVGAVPAGPYLQMYGTSNGQPWAINGGNAVTNIGFTVGGHAGNPNTLVLSQGFDQANLRWNQMINELGNLGFVTYLGDINKTGTLNGNAAPTTVNFTVGFNSHDQISTVALASEPDSGTTFVGPAAVQRAVARSLTESITTNRNVFDPTLTTFGPYVNRANPVQVINVTGAALDTVSNILVLSNNIVVTQTITTI